MEKDDFLNDLHVTATYGATDFREFIDEILIVDDSFSNVDTVNTNMSYLREIEEEDQLTLIKANVLKFEKTNDVSKTFLMKFLFLLCFVFIYRTVASSILVLCSTTEFFTLQKTLLFSGLIAISVVVIAFVLIIFLALSFKGRITLVQFISIPY